MTQKNDSLLLGHITIQNQVSDLNIMQVWLNQLHAKFAIDDRYLFKMDLVLNEAVPNIIEYAYPSNEIHPIDVSLYKIEAGFCLEIKDAGRAFNPLLRDYQPAKNLSEATVDGRGMHLIKQFTNKQVYQYIDNKNVLSLFFLI